MEIGKEFEWEGGIGVVCEERCVRDREFCTFGEIMRDGGASGYLNEEPHPV